MIILGVVLLLIGLLLLFFTTANLIGAILIFLGVILIFVPGVPYGYSSWSGRRGPPPV